MPALIQAIWRKKTFENPQWRKVKQMQPMWLCFFLGRRFEDTFENPHWRKVIQMQPMWPWFFSCKQFEGTFANPQWRKVKQMQPMWLCFFLGRGFEDTYEINTHEITQSFHTQLWINLKTHIKTSWPFSWSIICLSVFLDSHDNMAVHKSVQYVQDRMKIEGGGPGEGGYPNHESWRKFVWCDFWTKKIRIWFDWLIKKINFLI